MSEPVICAIHATFDCKADHESSVRQWSVEFERTEIYRAVVLAETAEEAEEAMAEQDFSDWTPHEEDESSSATALFADKNTEGEG